MGKDYDNSGAPGRYAGKGNIIKESGNGSMYADYKNTEDLRRMLTPNGKIHGRKRLGTTAREQRMIAQAIKRSRYMGLLPYTSATM